jgi:HEAT repeat protein
VKPLVDLLEDKDQRVRDAAAAALKSLTSQDFGDDVKRWRKWLEGQ